MKVAGAVALVTGANRGIGEGFVQVLLERGCTKVYAAARDPSLLPRFTDASRVVPLRLDVTKPEQCREAAAQAGDVTLLVNNAGLSHFGTTLLHDEAERDLRDELEVNLFGILNTYRSFREVLEHNGGGAIVNILSAAALMNVPLLSTYSVSKAAAASLTQAIRAATSAQKTLVTAAFVGSVDTRMAEHVPKEVVKVSPAFVARAVLDGVERNEEEIDTDPMAVDVRARIARDPKKMERFFARGLQLARKM